MINESNEDITSITSLIQAGFICFLSVTTITFNALVIASFINFKGVRDVVNYHLLSLAVVDLLYGLLVFPLSVHPALAQVWAYGAITCSLIGYLEVTLWVVTVYTFMWISVDRYLAVHTPLRYKDIQTKVKCQCWAAITWISAAVMCSPPLLGLSKPLFDGEAYVCVVNWKDMTPYTITLSVVVLCPNLITIIYAYTYIFRTKRKFKREAPKRDADCVEALSKSLDNPNHIMTFSLIMTFWISWAPLFGVRIWEEVTRVHLETPLLYFVVTWFGFMSSLWKPLILISLSAQFRVGLRNFCNTLRCWRRRKQVELVQLELRN